MNAESQGFTDYQLFVCYEDNPHEKGSTNWYAWRMGWLKASANDIGSD